MNKVYFNTEIGTWEDDLSYSYSIEGKIKKIDKEKIAKALHATKENGEYWLDPKFAREKKLNTGKLAIMLEKIAKQLGYEIDENYGISDEDEDYD